MDFEFPDALKVAKIIPLFKTGSPLDASNYRPISHLNSISKIYENIIYSRLTTFCEKHKILYDDQYGFRKFHSTEAALLNHIDKISEGFDSNNYIMSVYLDLSKAFELSTMLIVK